MRYYGIRIPPFYYNLAITLSLSWEIRDIDDNLNELNAEINRLKAIV